MNNEKKLDEIMDLLEKPLISYLRGLMEKVGRPISQEEAENMLGNIGTARMLKNQNRSTK